MAVTEQVELQLGDHVVQFYDRDEELVATVGGHLAGALHHGDEVIMVATPDHQKAFESALRAADVDVVAARASGSLRVADAADTLARLMVEGSPDAAAFDEVIGGLVRTAGQSGRPVRVYGEMVALLWDAGFVTATIELEELWNELGQRAPFSLFCAYPAHLVSGPECRDALADVCHAHTAVVGRSQMVDRSEARFEGGDTAPRQARHFVARTLQSWGCDDDVVDDASVVVTELATNAVRHAKSNFVVTIIRDRELVRVEVRDASPTPPALTVSGPGAVTGRGLALVAGLATRWGHDRFDVGKQVWAELASPSSS